MRSWLLVVPLLLVSATALADAVAPPPTDCPDGTRGNSSHTGPYCAPDTCTSNTDCMGGEICDVMDLCIVQQACGGLGFDTGPYPDGGAPLPCTFPAAHGQCVSGACGMGTCETMRVCQARPGTPSSSAGCGCAVGSREASMGAWIVALGIAITLARRASRRL